MSATSLKKTLIKDTSIYTLANYFSMGVGIAMSILMKAFLGQVGSGYWQTLKVVSSYGEYTDLGLRDTMMRDMAQSQGAGDLALAQDIRQTVFSFQLIASLVAAIGIYLFSIFYVSDLTLKNAMSWIALMVIATHAYSFFITVLRAQKKVESLSLVIVVNILLAFIFGLTGAKFYGVQGTAIGFTISTALSALIASKLSAYSYRMTWSLPLLKKLLKASIPMSLLSYAMITFLSMDTMIILRKLGVESLGYYTIALMAVAQVGAIGRFAHIIVFPHIQEQFGKSGSIQSTSEYFIRCTRALAVVVPVLIAGVFFILPPLVKLFLPKFIPGIEPMRWLLVGYFFIAVNEMSSTILYTVNKQIKLIPIYVISILLGFVILTVSLGMNLSLNAAAQAMGLAYFIFFTAVYFVSFHLLTGYRSALALWVKIMALFGYFCVTLYISLKISPVADGTWADILGLVLFGLLYLPVLIYFEKREHIFSLIFKK